MSSIPLTSSFHNRPPSGEPGTSEAWIRPGFFFWMVPVHTSHLEMDEKWSKWQNSLANHGKIIGKSMLSSMTTGWFLWGTHMTSRTPLSLICWLDDSCRGENHRTTNIQWGFSSKPCPVNPESIWYEPSSFFLEWTFSLWGFQKKHHVCCVCIDSWNLGGKSFQAVSKWGWTPLKWDEAATVYINTCVYCIILY